MSKMIGNINIDEFKSGKFVVNCVTKEDATEFINALHESGMRWYGGRTLKGNTDFEDYKKGTICYHAFKSYGLQRTYKAYYEKEGIKVIKYEKEQKEMKYSDLKDNWVVMLRNGRIGVIDVRRCSIAIIVNDNSAYDNYDDTFNYQTYTWYDIMKVWSTDGGEMKLVWERSEPTEKEIMMQQIAEMEEKLAEMKKTAEGMKL